MMSKYDSETHLLNSMYYVNVNKNDYLFITEIFFNNVMFCNILQVIYMNNKLLFEYEVNIYEALCCSGQLLRLGISTSKLRT